MNKFKINILALGFAGLGLTACSESFLDVESKTESSTGNFYKTESDAYRALLGCYDGWQCTTSNGGVGFYIASEMMADECFGGVGTADARNYQAIDRFDIAQSSADLNMFETDWKSYYAAIYRCNELITHEEQIVWNSTETQGTYMGECRALRALCYFDMVRLWGNIPLFTEPVNENRAQATPDEVYNVIFEDLKYAATNIPVDTYPKSDAATNDGHITAYAAKALLARVYLFYTGYYGKEPANVTKAEVLQGLEDFISVAESKGYGLVDNFKNLWPAASSSWAKDGNKYVQTNTYAGDGNKETVLAQKFNYTQNYNGDSDGNRWLVMMGVRGITSAPYGQGWGACTVNPKIVNAYGNGDNRKVASIIDLETEGITKVQDFVKTHVKDQREYTGYTVKKYTPMGEWRQDEKTGEWKQVNAVLGLGEGDFQISQYQDFVVMRYADVLLMAAELGSPNAKEYLNQVRRRAYTADGTVSPNFGEVEATKENILKERMLEFAFEGQRYWDLLRQGIDYAADHIAGSTNVLSGNTSDVVTIQAEKIKATKGLSQIPYNQITLSNQVLKQNEGW
ncbi:RagB/SusD family nutrient uptake outer membrane protein [Bacteroides sp.]|uniref:RagB/SusD family nutrient uptake outer membrane protein n=1 Tax=Bacteroides sp. TaxID=29523 RepID=UPI00262F7394|nr:RagB/SusD family nutrient uptake outer membrane protein [Bacteroides sp.]